MTTVDDLYSTLLHTERTKIDDPVGYTGGYQQARETRALFYMRFVQMEPTTFLVKAGCEFSRAEMLFTFPRVENKHG